MLIRLYELNDFIVHEVSGLIKYYKVVYIDSNIKNTVQFSTRTG